MSGLRRVERAVGRVLPRRTKDVVGRAYNSVRTRRADRQFEPADVDGSLSADAPRHVVLLTIDALRYDYVTPTTMPFFSSKNPAKAVTPATWTFPSVASLLTGRYPHEHGGMRQSDAVDTATTREIHVPTLSAGRTTLPEVLGGAGVETYGGFGFEMPFLALRSRFHRHRLYRDVNAEKVLDEYRSWLASRGNRRTFSYLHLSDPHTPHHPPDGYAKAFDVDLSVEDVRGWRYTDVTDPSGEVETYQENKRRLYMATLSYVDDVIAEHYDVLKSKFGPDVLVIVTSDHGEGFWEHAAFDAERFADSRPAYCVGHGGTPYECISRVPLWIDDDRMVPEGQPSLVDVAPTLLQLMGIADELPCTGQSLLTSDEDTRPLLTEATRYGFEKKAIYDGEWKLIVSRGDETTVECRWEDEPDGGPIPSEDKERMRDELPPWPADDNSTEWRVPETVERRLRNLGYQ